MRHLNDRASHSARARTPDAPTPDEKQLRQQVADLKLQLASVRSQISDLCALASTWVETSKRLAVYHDEGSVIYQDCGQDLSGKLDLLKQTLGPLEQSTEVESGNAVA